MIRNRTGLSCFAIAFASALALPATAAHGAEPAAAQQTAPASAYVVNLESTTGANRPVIRPELADGDHSAYVNAVTIRGVTWYRLRVGFFDTREAAQAYLLRHAADYPDAWIAKADPRENSGAAPPAQPVAVPAPAKSAAAAKPAKGGAAAAVALGAAVTTAPTLAATGKATAPTVAAKTIASAPLPKTAAAKPVPVTAAQAAALADLMTQAHDAMLANEYSKAIRLYTKVLEIPNSPSAQEAQEFLGLARERNGQMAHAKGEYETYLRLYPEGEGSERVRQRLIGLITAREASPQPLRAARIDNNKGKWEGFGSFSEYYRWDQSSYDGVSSTNQSAFISDLDYTTRRRGDSHDIRARFSGQFEHDDAGDAGDRGRISTFYVEALSNSDGFSGNLGRQSRSDSGILGRFDGGTISKPLSPRTKLNFTMGAPVEPGQEDRLNEHKRFYSLSLDATTVASGLDLNGYYIQQEVDGINDRQAVGTEARYVKDGRTVFALVDYDVSYATVNTVLLLAGLVRSDGATLNLILDYRQTPILMTSNALMSQPVRSIKELLSYVSESEVRKLAQARTAVSRSLTISASKPLSEKYQVMGDVTVTSISGTPGSDPVVPASEPIAESDSTGTEAYYSFQFIANGLLRANDSTIFGVRFSDAKTSDTTALSINHRFPVNDRFYLNPKLELDLRKDSKNGDDTTVKAGLRANYQYRNDLSFEAEFGGEQGNRQDAMGDSAHDEYFAYIGFRKEF